MHEPFCPLCRSPLVREVAARFFATVATSALGAAFGRRAGALLGAPVGYLIGDQIEAWYCGECRRSYRPGDLRAWGFDLR